VDAGVCIEVHDRAAQGCGDGAGCSGASVALASLFTAAKRSFVNLCVQVSDQRAHGGDRLARQDARLSA
jgi:hypothetical protein